MRPPDRALDGVGRSLAATLASGMTRRSFLGRLGTVVLGAVGGSAVAAAVAPEEAEAYHFCGHIYTTGSCPHPTGLPRIDRRGFPLRPRDGRPIDNLGRLVDVEGHVVDESGKRVRGPDGELLARAPRTRICEEWVPERFRIDARKQGSWYRCCNGQIRKLVDCCSPSRLRINGDASLVGYCPIGRRVFCITYRELNIRC
jgi:hypothetical protein